MERKYKIWQIVGVSILCAVIVLGAVLGVVFGINKSSDDLGDVGNLPARADDFFILESQEEHGITLCVSEASTAADGTTSKTITATVSPDSSITGEFEWSVAFANADSTWAKGKNVSDYVTLVQDVSNELKATVSCVEAFGEQIIVSIASKYTSASASCTVDYKRRITSVTLTIDKDDEFFVTLEGGKSYPDLYFIGTSDGHAVQVPEYEFMLDYECSDGTVFGTLDLRSYQSGVGQSTYNFMEGDPSNSPYVIFDENLHGKGEPVGDISLRVIYDGETIFSWDNIKVVEYATSISVDVTEIVF